MLSPFEDIAKALKGDAKKFTLAPVAKKIYEKYFDLYGENEIWVRPLYMWDEEVEVNGKTVKRFEFIG